MSWEILWRHAGRGVIFVALCGLDVRRLLPAGLGPLDLA